METISLDTIYADPKAQPGVAGQPAEHRQLVRKALSVGEPVYAYWWVEGVTGLLLATDRRIVHFPRFQERKGLFGIRTYFETWKHPYDNITGLATREGSFFEHARILLHRKGEDDAILVFPGLKLPEVEAIMKTLLAIIKYGRAHAPETPRVPVEEPDDSRLAEQLKELYDLYQQGALDDEEYAAAKKKLLAE